MPLQIFRSSYVNFHAYWDKNSARTCRSWTKQFRVYHCNYCICRSHHIIAVPLEDCNQCINGDAFTKLPLNEHFLTAFEESPQWLLSRPASNFGRASSSFSSFSQSSSHLLYCLHPRLLLKFNDLSRVS